MAIVGTEISEPVVEATTATAPEADSTVAPEANTEARVVPQGEVST
jgi:hypothetical protein